MQTKTADTISEAKSSQAPQPEKITGTINPSPESQLPQEPSIEEQKQAAIQTTPPIPLVQEQIPQQATPAQREPYLKKTEREARIFILTNDKRKGTVSLDVEEDVIDPKTGHQRRMRLLRGANSIWFDEQSPNVFPKEYVAKNILTLEFNKGKCIIPMRDTMRLLAAELTHRNMDNQKKYGNLARRKDLYFYEWDPIAQNEKAQKEEELVIKAMQLAMTAPMEEIVPHAQYLNIQFQDEQGVPIDDNALRTEYIRFAKNKASQFLNSVHSPIVKMTHIVKRAVERTMIDIGGRQPGAAYWHDGGFITTLPQGRDGVEYLVEFAMTHGDANAAFANQLRELDKT